MNSSLQCLSNVEELTTFLINNSYLADLNPKNVLAAGINNIILMLPPKIFLEFSTGKSIVLFYIFLICFLFEFDTKRAN